MDRTAMSVAAVLALALLAGCSGVTGGDANATAVPNNTTATPAPSAETPAPDQQPSASTMVIESVSVSPDSVMVNRSATIEATINNTGDTTGEQTVDLQVVGTVTSSKRVALDTGEQTTISFVVNTSARDPGQYAFTVMTANNSGKAYLTIDENRTYEQFFDELTVTAPAVSHTRVLSADTVRVAFEDNHRYEDVYKDQTDRMPAPQALAYMMADNPERTPDRVDLVIVADDVPVWSTNLTQSLAEQYVNNTIQPDEYRRQLTDRARGPWADRRPDELENMLTWTQGDLARRAYATEIAERLRNSNWSHAYTITDYGLYNETIQMPDPTVKFGPNESIYIEVQTPRDSRDNEVYTYRRPSWTATGTGIASFELLFTAGNATLTPHLGERPRSIYLRQVDENGIRHLTEHYPVAWTQAAVIEDNDFSPQKVMLSITFDEELRTFYGKDGVPKDT